jgi:uroporphyrinogen decarboxylase
LQKITDVTINYLKAQVKAGADTVQVFDSWSGILSPGDFKIFAQPYLLQIADALENDAPVILFPKGSWYALNDLSNSSAAGIGIDWCVTPQFARKVTENKITLQGNFDPAKITGTYPADQKMGERNDRRGLVRRNILLILVMVLHLTYRLIMQRHL